MNRQQIERYFTALAKEYPKKCVIILTGAAAGALYGRIRATMDIDFSASTRDWDTFAEAVSKVSKNLAIAAQFGEDIGRWSSISFLDYKKHAYLHKRFGSIEVRLMEPSYWAIGKLSRYLDSDVRDLMSIFKKTKTPWRKVASVAGLALAKSPKSSACFLFKRQTEDFFLKFGRRIWGKSFNAQDALDTFHRYAKRRK